MYIFNCPQNKLLLSSLILPSQGRHSKINGKRTGLAHSVKTTYLKTEVAAYLYERI